MINLLHVEFKKLFLNKYYFIILTATAALHMIIPLDSHGRCLNNETIGITFYNSSILVIMSMLLGVVYYGTDIGNGTLKNIICAGHSRKSIFLCKAVIFFGGTSIVSLSGPILSMVKYSYLGQSLGSSNIIINSVICEVLNNMAYASISILVCFICRTSSKAMGICSIVLFSNVAFINSFEEDIFNSVVKYCPIMQMRLILYRPIINDQFLSAYLTGIIWLVLIMGTAYICFKYKELH